MKDIKLVGHSGCKLEINDNNGRLFVTKTSKNKEYNKRLKEQCDKQKMFKNNFFKAPIVFESCCNKDGLFNFSMEYINGLTVSEYFRNIEIGNIEDLVKIFFEIIPDNNNFDDGAGDIFISKIKELEEKINIKNNKFLSDVFCKLKKFDWSYCVNSNCHGDMTLENIILSDDKLYLIDFLDSFYNSWMIDVAKILQDIECKWSYRFDRKTDENLETRLLIFRQLLLKKIISLKDGDKILNTIYCILLINLLRIIPYTNDSLTSEYLKNEIEKIFKKINFL
jgi:thiamine kinase-like enzyme